MINPINVARVCHEANRAYCQSLGDNSQPSWDDAPDWQKSSAMSGVVFHYQNPEAGDSAAHDKWMKDKLKDGWVFGEVKDPEAKTHPCLVPFNELPVEQQIKDTLFRSIVRAMT